MRARELAGFRVDQELIFADGTEKRWDGDGYGRDGVDAGLGGGGGAAAGAGNLEVGGGDGVVASEMLDE